MMRTEMVLETWVHLLFKHLIQVIPQGRCNEFSAIEASDYIPSLTFFIPFPFTIYS
jgi:hypothetical protein